MSNDSTPTQPERTEPTLPQFDPTSTSAPVPPSTTASGSAPDETQVLPSAATARTPIVPPATPYTYAAGPASSTEAGPALATPVAAPAAAEAVALDGAPGTARSTRWSGKKTAITAGLALVLTSAGAIGAAAALPSGSTAETGRFGGPGQGGRTLPLPGGQGQQVLPNQQGGSQLPVLPGPGSGSDSDSDSDSDSGGLTGLDPNQLLQMSPNELLQMLNDQGQLGSGSPGQTDPFDQGDSGQGGSGQDDSTSQDGSASTT